MRTAVVLIATSLVFTACYRESRPYDRNRYEATGPQRFEAYTTDGETVLVEQDPRTGDLYIVGPGARHGEPVAIVNRDDHGRMLVTRDVKGRRYEGSGGDGRHDDDHR
jgi:hypothetical protein